MKTFLLDISLLVATITAGVSLHDVVYYLLAAVTIFKYAIDIAKFIESKILKKKNEKQSNP